MSEVIGTHFVVDAGPVGFDGFGGDGELAADFTAGVTFDQEIQHFAFSFGDATQAVFDVVQILADEVAVDVVELSICTSHQSEQTFATNRVQKKVEHIVLYRLHGRRSI